jgi:uncharacterized metal-binding protein
VSDEKRVVIVACAGMDKAFGSVAMLSAFRAVEVLRPDKTVLIALPPLLVGVSAYVELVKRHPVIVIDGCSERCAMKSIAKCGGHIRGRILVTDGVKKHGLKPDSASNVGSDGVNLAERVAEEVASLVDGVIGG